MKHHIFAVGLSILGTLIVLSSHDGDLHAGAFRFAYRCSIPGLVMHPQGYTGAGGTLRVTVGIDPTSLHATQMVTSVRNIVRTINSLVPTSDNIDIGAGSGVPAHHLDFESLALHEVLHSLGLAHPNAGTESRLTGRQEDYARATRGRNRQFNLNAGDDGIIASADDLRGDDENLLWFRRSNNNPFTIADTVDRTTYSRDALAALPPDHSFATSPSRAVGNSLGFSSTEAVMHQRPKFQEVQRTLTHDDVSILRYAMSGLDEQANTQDDYVLELQYVGESSEAHIVLDFDNSKTSTPANSGANLSVLTETHATIARTAVYFREDRRRWLWHFTERGPDLVVLSGQARYRSDEVDGPLTVSVSVRNQGGATARQTRVKFYRVGRPYDFIF